MKSKDLQKVVLSKYQKGDTPKQIYHDLNGGLGLRTIERWCQMIRRSGTITLSKPPGGPRLVRTRENIQKGYIPIKKVIEPLLSDDQKLKRKQFANWVRTNFRKEDTLKILFSDEKMFDIDRVYNTQNDRVWAVDRADADKNGGTQQKRKFPQKVMVWLGACSKGLTPLVILDEGTVDHTVYIEKVLPVALKYGNQFFGSDWVFQQDGAKPHSHHLSQKWCRDNFPTFIEKDRWPPNSPDLNPLDYSIWDQLVNNINWNKVYSKTTLIMELKLSVKKISESVVFESCACWTNRLYRLYQNDGSYLR
ncbi:unnamed protein product [Rotaria socialis]|uniref:Uncharacterized protein n=1 Tax=Rotaria socialis TaxID=392032 RepID=A0A818YX37_9BILA|nr:unnamed protein product [Rotaria socialis]